jgi:alpha-1,6-mannosyltransferase
VDVETFHPRHRDPRLRARWGADPDDVVLLHAGRLSSAKGTHTVIEAAPGMLRDRRVHIAFAGRGGLGPQIEAMAAGHQRVHHLGYVQDPAQMGRIFASADGYLGTGPSETFGLSIIEALASGLPVVVTDKGAGAELGERSKASIAFRADNPEDLCRSVTRLLERDRVDLGAQARRFAETEGSWDHTFETLTDHYLSLLGRVPAASREISPVAC